MSLSSLALFAAALLVAAGSPGPSIAALVARVLTNGVRDVLPFLAAMWLGEVIWLTCAVAGLTALAHTFAFGFLVLKFAGIAYLVFLAWKMWFAPADEPSGQLPRGQSPLRMFLTGIAVTLGNPKIMIFYVALLPTMVDLSRAGRRRMARIDVDAARRVDHGRLRMGMARGARPQATDEPPRDEGGESRERGRDGGRRRRDRDALTGRAPTRRDHAWPAAPADAHQNARGDAYPAPAWASFFTPRPRTQSGVQDIHSDAPGEPLVRDGQIPAPPSDARPGSTRADPRRRFACTSRQA